MGYSNSGRPLYILDGYNIVFSNYFKSKSDDIETLRDELNEYLEVYTLKKNVDVIIVWDGSESTSFFSTNRGNVKNVFAKPPENADLKIIKIVEMYNPRGRIIVVSNDRRHIISVVKNLGAKTMNVKDFLGLVGYGNKHLNNVKGEFDIDSEDEKKPVEDLSVEEWLKIFKSKKRRIDR